MRQFKDVDSEIIERPQLKDYLTESVSVSDVQKMFGANSPLYKYIVALDNYIDHLEGDCNVSIEKNSDLKVDAIDMIPTEDDIDNWAVEAVMLFEHGEWSDGFEEGYARGAMAMVDFVKENILTI